MAIKILEILPSFTFSDHITLIPVVARVNLTRVYVILPQDIASTAEIGMEDSHDDFNKDVSGSNAGAIESGTKPTVVFASSGGASPMDVEDESTATIGMEVQQEREELESTKHLSFLFEALEVSRASQSPPYPGKGFEDSDGRLGA